ncbi:hypothetical protein AGMMS4952_09070 [Spirochaetia bacterium]|nr:hypothetical protein AGMMS4952_09070 [Spirochaetia bacterium]
MHPGSLRTETLWALGPRLREQTQTFGLTRQHERPPCPSPPVFVSDVKMPLAIYGNMPYI